MTLCRWDHGKESCGKAGKLGRLPKGQGTLAMGTETPCSPCHSSCARERIWGPGQQGQGPSSLRRARQRPVGSKGNQGREAAAGCWPGLGVLGHPSPPVTCHAALPGPEGWHFLHNFRCGGVRNKAQQSLLIFKLSA